jgi:hypothetical protein
MHRGGLRDEGQGLMRVRWKKHLCTGIATTGFSSESVDSVLDRNTDSANVVSHREARREGATVNDAPHWMGARVSGTVINSSAKIAIE